MRVLLCVIATLIALPVSFAAAKTAPPLAGLPLPIQSYALALTPYCKQIGRHTVVTNGLYTDSLFGALDVNVDGKRDYIIYKCMFGCDGEPYALQGLGPGCMFGSLLLSSAADYLSVPMPGQLVDVEPGPKLRVSVYREHINAEDCSQWYCNYVFELRENWFRLVAPCPEQGCRAVLSQRREAETRQGRTNLREGGSGETIAVTPLQ